MTEENLVTLTADIVAAHVSNNRISTDDIGGLIGSVYESLIKLGTTAEPEAPVFEAAVTVRKSLSNPAHLISMIDGKPYKMLKRHIGQHGMTPAEYRTRYGLPADYPMVAPNYAEQRKAIAVRIGLGRKKAEPAPAPTLAKAARKPRAAKPAAIEAPAKTAAPAAEKPAKAPRGIKAAKAAARAHLGEA